jgi:hypothetical protein
MALTGSSIHCCRRMAGDNIVDLTWWSGGVNHVKAAHRTEQQCDPRAVQSMLQKGDGIGEDNSQTRRCGVYTLNLGHGGKKT